MLSKFHYESSRHSQEFYVIHQTVWKTFHSNIQLFCETRPYKGVPIGNAVPWFRKRIHFAGPYLFRYTDHSNIQFQDTVSLDIKLFCKTRPCKGVPMGNAVPWFRKRILFCGSLLILVYRSLEHTISRYSFTRYSFTRHTIILQNKALQGCSNGKRCSMV